MLYNFILNFVDTFTFLNVFKYLTFRTGLAMFTSMIIVLLIGTPFINFFSAKQILSPIREDGPSDHIIKKIGTPTMGGVLIILGLFISILLWGDLSNIFEMMANTGGDLLRQYVIEPGRHDEIIDLLQKIVDYGNEIFDLIRKRYNCRLPRNIYV